MGDDDVVPAAGYLDLQQKEEIVDNRVLKEYFNVFLIIPMPYGWLTHGRSGPFKTESPAMTWQDFSA